MVEMAAMDGSTPYSIAVKIFTGSVIWPAPSRKIDTGTLSNDTMNENSAPAATPGRISGSVTVKNATGPLAPSTRAALSISGSMPCRLAITARTTYGTVITMWARARPTNVPFTWTSA